MCRQCWQQHLQLERHKQKQRLDKLPANPCTLQYQGWMLAGVRLTFALPIALLTSV